MLNKLYKWSINFYITVGFIVSLAYIGWTAGFVHCWYKGGDSYNVSITSTSFDCTCKKESEAKDVK